MTTQQRDIVRSLVSVACNTAAAVFHHGDCVGADAEFHAIVREFGGRIVGHIPSNRRLRALCTFDEERKPLPYMTRNREIVRVATVVFATPYEMRKQSRGGTWSTIGLARELNKPVVIVLPDGTIEVER